MYAQAWPHATTVVIVEGAGAEDIDRVWIARLGVRFGLTERESEVLTKVSNGLAPEEIAKVLGISEPTVRTHLARLFQKTGCHRQADFVRLILRGNT